MENINLINKYDLKFLKTAGQEAFKWLNENNLIHLLD